MAAARSARWACDVAELWLKLLRDREIPDPGVGFLFTYWNATRLWFFGSTRTVTMAPG
jgi:hypothetical protein